MSIFYVNAPAFAAAVERRRDPSLERVPLAVVSGGGAQAAVVCVSPEAYALGVRQGQKVSEARRFDRRLRLVAADPVLYEKAQSRLMRVIRRYTPVYEAERPGSFYLDMSGTERLFGKAMDAAARVRSDIARVLSLRATVGVAENKLVSRVAANVARPTGLCDVFPGNEADFLSPLDLDYLPAFGDFGDSGSFRELALSRVGDVARVPLNVLIRLFGRKAETLHQQALGVDPRAVTPPQAEDAIAEDVAVAPETNDDRALLSLLWSAVETLGRRLREKNAVAAEIRLTAWHADGKRLFERIALKPPTDVDGVLFRTIETAWRSFFQRRVALKALNLSLAGLRTSFRQIAFERDDRESKLLKTLDGLRGRFGPGAVRLLK